MKLPKLVSEEQLYEWYGKGVLRRVYKLPDGRGSDFYIFSGQQPVIIFALTADYDVIAVRQFRYGVNDIVLELPGGVINSGDTPEEAVRKELLEETGYSPASVQILGKPIWFEPSAFTVAFLPFLALDCQKAKEPELEKTEIMETVLVPLNEWVQMIYRGEVCDSKSIAITFLTLHYLGLIDLG